MVASAPGGTLVLGLKPLLEPKKLVRAVVKDLPPASWMAESSQTDVVIGKSCANIFARPLASPLFAAESEVVNLLPADSGPPFPGSGHPY